MALIIDNPETVRLAHLLAEATGESLEEAVATAPVARLQHMVQALPVLDSRSADEIIGYDQFGLPK